MIRTLLGVALFFGACLGLTGCGASREAPQRPPLTVTVSEGAPPPQPVPLPESGLVRAWHDGTGGFLDAVEGAIRIAGPLLFALLCAAALAVGGRALWRRYQRHSL